MGHWHVVEVWVTICSVKTGGAGAARLRPKDVMSRWSLRAMSKHQVRVHKLSKSKSRTGNNPAVNKAQMFTKKQPQNGSNARDKEDQATWREFC